MSQISLLSNNDDYYYFSVVVLGFFKKVHEYYTYIPPPLRKSRITFLAWNLIIKDTCFQNFELVHFVFTTKKKRTPMRIKTKNIYVIKLLFFLIMVIFFLYWYTYHIDISYACQLKVVSVQFDNLWKWIFTMS